MVTAAIVLAGGKATRLGDGNPPKALLKVNGRTLLEWQLDWLKEKFNVVLALGHRSDEVIDFVRQKNYNVKWSIESSPLGTGGAVKKAFLDCCPEAEKVYVLNVDDLARVDLSVLNQSTPCLVGKPLPFSICAGGKIFPQNEAIQHIGHTILSKEDILNLPDNGSLEKWLSSQKNVNTFVHNGLWVTVNSIDQLRQAEELWRHP